MPVSDGDIVRGVLHGTMPNGDEFVNVFTWLIDKISVGAWSDPEIGTFITDAIELIFAEVLAQTRNTVTYDTVDIYKFALGLWDYLTTTIPSITPTDVSHPLPAGVAALMTAYTDRNKVFGRKFLAGWTEATTTDGFIDVVPLAALADAAAEYLSNYSGGTMGPLDNLIPGVYSAAAVDFEPFNGIAVVKNVWSYQRRRKSGVGV